MKTSDFTPKMSFYDSDAKEYLCTDVFQNYITAIYKEPFLHEIWFQGPPYVLETLIFDTHDIEKFFLKREDIKFINSHQNLLKFLSKDELYFILEKQSKSKYNKKKNFKYIRKKENGDLLYPYDAHKIGIFEAKEKTSYHLSCFNINTKNREIIEENDFIQLPVHCHI